MKNRHIVVLVSLIFFLASQSAHSSVRKTFQNNWSFFNSSLELSFNQQLTVAQKKNKSKPGWQFNEPKLTRISPTLIPPNYGFELIDKYNFESSFTYESPMGGGGGGSNFNALNNQFKTVSYFPLCNNF